MAGVKIKLLCAILLLFLLSASPALAQRVVMLGDSLTAGGPWSRLLPGQELFNLGVSGETCEQIGRRAAQAAELQPDLIFLMAGVNDFGRVAEPADHIVSSHLAIWEDISARRPDTRLIIQSLLPVSNKRYSKRFNLRISEVNRRLKIEAENKGLTFVDLNEQMADDQGQLPDELTYDGLHLTAAAYEIWAETIKPYIR